MKGNFKLGTKKHLNKQKEPQEDMNGKGSQLVFIGVSLIIIGFIVIMSLVFLVRPVQNDYIVLTVKDDLLKDVSIRTITKPYLTTIIEDTRRISQSRYANVTIINNDLRKCQSSINLKKNQECILSTSTLLTLNEGLNFKQVDFDNNGISKVVVKVDVIENDTIIFSLPFNIRIN